jgi:hypothetical protein
MTDILAQIGDKLGSKIKELEALINSGGGGGGNPTSPTDDYSEIGYDANGNVSTVTTYTDSTKATLVKTKTLSYTSGSLTGMVVTDSGGNTVLTQTLAYDATSGDLDSIEKDYA